MRVRDTQKLVVIGLVLLWIMTLSARVVTLRIPGGQFAVMNGAQVFGQGWLGPVELQFGWYANLLFAAVLYVLREGGGSDSGLSPIILGSLLLVPTISAFFWADVLLDEGGGRAPIIAYHLGYYAWLAEMITAAVLAITMGVRRYKRRGQPENL